MVHSHGMCAHAQSILRLFHRMSQTTCLLNIRVNMLACLGSGEDPGHLSLCCHTEGKVYETSQPLLTRAPNPLHEGFHPHDLVTPESSALSYHNPGIRFRCVNFG